MGLDPGLGVLMGAGMVLLDFGDAPHFCLSALYFSAGATSKLSGIHWIIATLVSRWQYSVIRKGHFRGWGQAPHQLSWLALWMHWPVLVLGLKHFCCT